MSELTVEVKEIEISPSVIRSAKNALEFKAQALARLKTSADAADARAIAAQWCADIERDRAQTEARAVQLAVDECQGLSDFLFHFGSAEDIEWLTDRGLLNL